MNIPTIGSYYKVNETILIFEVLLTPVKLIKKLLE